MLFLCVLPFLFISFHCIHFMVFTLSSGFPLFGLSLVFWLVLVIHLFCSNLDILMLVLGLVLLSHLFCYNSYILMLVLWLVLLSHLPSIGLLWLNRHVSLFSTFRSVACYFSLIRGYFYDYFHMLDRIIILITHSFISDSSLLIIVLSLSLIHI